MDFNVSGYQISPLGYKWSDKCNIRVPHWYQMRLESNWESFGFEDLKVFVEPYQSYVRFCNLLICGYSNYFEYVNRLELLSGPIAWRHVKKKFIYWRYINHISKKLQNRNRQMDEKKLFGSTIKFFALKTSIFSEK